MLTLFKILPAALLILWCCSTAAEARGYGGHGHHTSSHWGRR